MINSAIVKLFMSKTTNQNKAKSAISFSSIDTQRDIRIEKLKKLRSLGIDPFTPNSRRDFELDFIKHWFDFIHKFNYSPIIEEDEELNNFDYFLHLVLFPRTLLEKMEEKLHLRYTVRQMGLDPDEDEDVFGEDFDQSTIDEARVCLGAVLKLSEDRRMDMLRTYLNYVPLHENDKEENEGRLTISVKANQKVTLSGRIKSKRTSGKIAFATVEDEHCPDGFQFILKKDDLPAETTNQGLSFDSFIELIDEGDYIQAYGRLDYSQRGEPSLFVEKLMILTKSLKPLPEKLEDVELRFRQRYVDMKLNTEVRDILVKKSKFWSHTKDFMDDNRFLQVEAPIMQETTGGAEANPFVTHHDALDQDYYLGISPELHLKRFVVGGFEKVYDLGRNFRNEGIDDEHLQEFTRVEFYWAYANHDNLIAFTERLIKYVIEKTFGTSALLYKEKNEKGEFTGNDTLVDWSKDWPRMSYYDFIQHFGGIDISKMDEAELRKTAISLGIKVDEADGFGRLTDLIYKKVARPRCIEPVWLIDVPTRMSPLAKKDPSNPEVSLRSHLLAYGSELTNGFSELNDPIEQLERFMEQQSLRDGGDDEAMMLDTDYVNALEYGMPPTVGFAYSERLFAALMNCTIRESSPFPLMRNIDTAKKRTMRADVIILDDESIPAWSKFNTVAHLNASFASRIGKALLHYDKSETKDGEELAMNITHAIMIKKTATMQDLWTMKTEAESLGLSVSVFTQDMQDSSDDDKVHHNHLIKNKSEIKLLGILIYGKKGEVESITDGCELFE